MPNLIKNDTGLSGVSPVLYHINLEHIYLVKQKMVVVAV